jgi:hypothetical protein
LGQQKTIFILGGIISHNKELYECNLRKAMKRLILMSQLHELRLSSYIQHYEAVDYEYSLYDCKDYYRGAKGNLSAITYFDEPVLLMDNFRDMRTVINNLEGINRLIRIFGDCARIY